MTAVLNTIKDMFAHRKGRLESKVIQLWANKYKNKFLNETEFYASKQKDVGKSGSQAVNVWRKEYKNVTFEQGIILCHSYNYDHLPKHMLQTVRKDEEAAEVAVDAIVEWLDTPVGRAFIAEAFDVSVPEANDSLVKNSVPVYNYEFFKSQEALEKLLSQTEGLEIAIDTLVGWFNSHVGRCFLIKALSVEINRYPEDGTE